MILWDTLLNDFSPAEIRLVLAHELRRIGWIASSCPCTGADGLLHPAARRARVAEAVPLALLILVVTQLAAGPLLNAAFRREEAAAALGGPHATLQPRHRPRLMHKKPPTKSLAEPDPPAGPTRCSKTTRRSAAIALAQAWEERSAAGC